MKLEEKKMAIELRKRGFSMKEIAKELNISKASVSLWVGNVILTKKQKAQLSTNGQRVEVVEKRRISRLANTAKNRRSVMDLAKRDITNLSLKDLKLIGTTLYWAEGGKSMKGIARVSNSNPTIIKVMMRFFREICGVEEEKFRGHIHTHSHINSKNAEKYWSEVTKIPFDQFYKTYAKPSKASLGKKDSLPFGTFDIYVCNTKLFLTIMGWIEKVGELVISQKKI